MSLLMDALKKAELAKRQAQGEDAGAAAEEGYAQGGLELEPLGNVKPAAPATDPAAASLPQLTSHLEELDAQFLADAKQAAAARLKAAATNAGGKEPAPEQAAPEAQGRQPPKAQARPAATEPASARQSAAQNVFAAKQNEKPPSSKAFAITIGVTTMLAISGIGGYFWWQLQPKSSLVASRPATPPPANAPAPKPVSVTPAPALAPVPTAPAAGSPAAATAQARADKGEEEDAAAAPPRAAAQARRPAPPPVAEAEGPVRVTRAPLKVNPALLRGFDAFNRGDLAVAQSEYERAQKSDPRNTDAMHGLAAIALRQGRVDQAEALYRQITEADPQDSVAAAALINIRGQVDPGAAESRLKSLSAAQPELAGPHFSLGNLYARHGRWNDAQQAYFRAYTAEPDNPDILYNLAISLEHLRQNKLAAQYYSQAIAAAQTRPAGFDKAQAAARLATLQP